MTDHMLLPGHRLQFITRMTSLERKLLPLTTTVKPSWEVNKNNMLIFLSWSLEVLYVVVHHDTLHEMKQSTVASKANWSFLSPPDTLSPPGRAIFGLISCSLTSALGRPPWVKMFCRSGVAKYDVAFHCQPGNARALQQSAVFWR